MKKFALVALPLAAMLGVAACSSNTYADVVRFHTNQPITRGTLAIVAADPSVANTLEFRTHAETVAIEMRRLGYSTGLPANQVQYIATVDITQTDGQGNVTRPGAAAGPVVPAGNSSRRNPNLRTTTLAVQIQRASDQTKIWEGRASKEAEAGSTGATATAAVPALAGALFSDFPGKPGVTQQVRI